jgi:hypothetical protein
MRRVTHCLLGTALFGLLMIDGWGCSSPPERSGKDWTLRLAPEAALADVVEDWAERWSAATGRTILVGTEGAPVTVEDDLVSPNGKTACELTSTKFHEETGEWVSTDWIHIDLTPPWHCAGWGYSIGHAMGHGLSACGHTTAKGSLMQDGLEQGTQYVIDEASLELVCATSECTTFAPETLQ